MSGPGARSSRLPERPGRPVLEPFAPQGLRPLRTAIVDTGPLVAFLNRRDRYHAWAAEQFDSLTPPLLTCEAVLSEAAYMVRGLTGGPEAVLELVARGVVKPTFRLQDEIAAVRTLVRRYARDLADACLVRLSELHSDCVVLTIDTEFRDVYRRNGRQMIPTLLPPGPMRRRH
jgi:predicted nucleic acid-binding protein